MACRKPDRELVLSGVSSIVEPPHQIAVKHRSAPVGHTGCDIRHHDYCGHL